MLSWRNTTHPLAGGAEFYTDRLLRELAQRGHEITWFSALSDGAQDKTTIPPYEVVRKGSRLTVYREGKRWARQNLAAFDVFVDQVNTVPFQIQRVVPQDRVIGLFHQTAEDVWPYNAPQPIAMAGRYLLEPRWIRSFRDSKVMVLSNSTAACLEDWGVKPIVVLGVAGEDDRAPQSRITSAQDPIRVVSVSRLVGYKRVDHVIRSVEIARQYVPELQLDVVGDGPEFRRLRRNSPDWVTFHGRCSLEERERIVQQSAFHIACSVREGWGLTVTEAAQLGVPTIGYRVPGLIDSIEAAKGFLVEPNPTHLGQQLGQLIQSGVHREYRAPTRGGASTWELIADRFECGLRQ